MKLRVLDTNRLIKLWRGQLSQHARFQKVDSLSSARRTAREWRKQNPVHAIVTPVKLEFLCGIRQKEQLEWADAFLGEFELIDGGKIKDKDWKIALDLARDIRKKSREDVPKRDANDCLIRAICDRLHAEIISDDMGMPQ